ncbi:TlpA family protein disulfide reductase [Melioribacteraceae bacterium 4301-Me]|uniref:TlpA family protein disulfide reductase n=1 Tax=Pyranulibacter aquaticus TaxID=3163344 RepID=UPI0035984133
MKPRGNLLTALLFLFSILILTTDEAQVRELKVEKIDKKKLEDILKNRNQKLLFLNLWATWCVPCREEFPDIIKLVNDYKNKPIDFYGISIDYPDEVNSKVIPFLKKQKANFTSFVNGFDKDEDLINMLDKNWNGALPSTFIFDKSGKKVSLLEGKQTYKIFKNELDRLLK